ncbi:MAG: hypothetical protein SOZ96_05895 [Treponema sp.]|nr:hypothetical protein [Treponema sp.]
MGFIVLVLCSPVLIPLIIIALVLGLKGDEWFNHKPSRQKSCYYYDEIDDYDYDFGSAHFDDAASYDSGSSDSPLYGGLPYGDGELFIVDHEDLIDQMDF